MKTHTISNTKQEYNTDKDKNPIDGLFCCLAPWIKQLEDLSVISDTDMKL